MDRDEEVRMIASDTWELNRQMILDFKTVRSDLDKTIKWLEDRQDELQSIISRCKGVPPPEKTTIPESTAIAEDEVLSAAGLPERAWKPLVELGVNKLSELARCRKDDIDRLPGLSPASRKAIYGLLEEKGIVLKEGLSFIEITKLREACVELSPPGTSATYGHLIGYRQIAGRKNKWEFTNTPKFYFQAYDNAVVFLKAAGVSDSEEKLKKLGFDSF